MIFARGYLFCFIERPFIERAFRSREFVGGCWFVWTVVGGWVVGAVVRFGVLS